VWLGVRWIVVDGGPGFDSCWEGSAYQQLCGAMRVGTWCRWGVASWSSCISWFVAMGTPSGTYIPVASSVNCAVPNISGFVWNWSGVNKEADASKIITFPCSVLVEVVEVLVWQRKVVSWFPGRWNIHEEPHRCRSGVVWFSNIFLWHTLRLSAA